MSRYSRSLNCRMTACGPQAITSSSAARTAAGNGIRLPRAKMASTFPTSVVQDGSGRVWVAVSNGVGMYDGGQWHRWQRAGRVGGLEDRSARRGSRWQTVDAAGVRRTALGGRPGDGTSRDGAGTGGIQGVRAGLCGTMRPGPARPTGFCDSRADLSACSTRPTACQPTRSLRCWRRPARFGSARLAAWPATISRPGRSPARLRRWPAMRWMPCCWRPTAPFGWGHTGATRIADGPGPLRRNGASQMVQRRAAYRGPAVGARPGRRRRRRDLGLAQQRCAALGRPRLDRLDRDRRRANERHLGVPPARRRHVGRRRYEQRYLWLEQPGRLAAPAARSL